MTQRRLTVLGAGESGLGIALLAQQKGLKVFVSQDKKLSQRARNTLQKHRIPFEEKHSQQILDADFAIKSPGIPNTAEVVSYLKEHHIPIESEISFAYSFIDGAKIIGITGTNGKTSTTLLITHILRQLGYAAIPVGNVGYGLCHALYQGEKVDYYVLELSSFQLEYVGDFRCDIAILLNIHPDHMDRYVDFNAYAATKMQITKNQTAQDDFIYNGADLKIIALLGQYATFAQLLDFSKSNVAQQIEISGYIHPDTLSSAVALSEVLGLSQKDVCDAISSFQGVSHRMQFVRQWNGITFINDSKATNTAAVRFALGAVSGQIIWILGGEQKGGIDYPSLISLGGEKVKKIFFHAKDSELLRAAFERKSPQKIGGDFSDMSHLIEKISRCAEAGDTVLFSPAFASFDLYRNFEHRGEIFCQAVFALK